jgi:YgiT-type zinc finger domain-containing protein
MANFLHNSEMTCPECQVGKYHLKLVAYYTYLGTELITVPDFPCWVCDVCKRQDYDQTALSQVYMMLSANLGKPLERGRKNKPSKLSQLRSQRQHQTSK